MIDSLELWHKSLQDELDRIRRRLHALEQNTVPAAKQKPREFVLTRAPGSLEFRVVPDGGCYTVPSETIRVREVLDE